MSFMEPEVYKGYGYDVELEDGSSYVVPADIVEGKPTKKELSQYRPESHSFDSPVAKITRINGYFAHLTAPGYMDQTDWEFFATKKEVDEWLEEQEEDDEADENPSRRVRQNPEDGWYAIVADSDYRGGRIMVAITQTPSETVKRTQREYDAWIGKGDVQVVGPFKSAAAASAAGKEQEKVPRR